MATLRATAETQGRSCSGVAGSEEVVRAFSLVPWTTSSTRSGGAFLPPRRYTATWRMRAWVVFSPRKAWASVREMAGDGAEGVVSGGAAFAGAGGDDRGSLTGAESA